MCSVCLLRCERQGNFKRAEAVSNHVPHGIGTQPPDVHRINRHLANGQEVGNLVEVRTEIQGRSEAIQGIAAGGENIHGEGTGEPSQRRFFLPGG